MILRPLAFEGLPFLPTKVLAGAGGDDARLLFSRDSQYLLLHSGASSLQVWHVESAQPLCAFDGRHVHAAKWSEGRNEIIGVVEDSIASIVPGMEGGERLIVTNVPPIGLEEPRCLAVSSQAILVCTSRRLLVYAITTGELLADVADPLPVGYRLRDARFVQASDSTSIRLWSTSVSGRTGHLHIRQIDLVGRPVLDFLMDIPPQLARSSSAPEACLGIRSIGDGQSLVVICGEDQTVRISAIDHHAINSTFSFSPTGESFLIAAADRVAVWRRHELVAEFSTDGQWFNAWPSDDAARIVVTYNTATPQISKVSGVVETLTGRAVGQTVYHMCGTPSVVFSRDGRFFASVIDDALASIHPSRLDSGSVVVSQLFS